MNASNKTNSTRSQARDNGSTALAAGTPAPDFALKSTPDQTVSLGLDARRLISEVQAEAHASRIREDFRSGARNGVNGTPTFFINGVRYDGPVDPESMMAYLARAADT